VTPTVSKYLINYTVAANTGASRNATLSISYPNLVNYTLAQDAPAPTATSASPPSVPQGTSKTVTFTGTNFFSGDTATVSTSGVSLSNFSVISSTQASATITVTTGAPTGAFPVKFISPLGTANTTASIVQVVPQLLITAPTSLANGTVGTAYGPVTFTASGGTGGYTWSAGSGMPGGLSISSSGVLSGTPTGQGSFSPTFTVNDSQLDSANVTLPITINPAPLTAITIQTSPTGLKFTVDGGAAQTAPQTVNLSPGSHTIAVATTQAGSVGTQYVFANWSDGGAASHSITVGSTAATYTATFTTQYQLTISASPVAGGTVTPSSGSYYASGTAVPITATPNSGYTFSGWSGSVASPSAASTTVTMSAPQAVTANFSSQTGVTIQTSPTGLLFSVDGGAAQTAPQTLNLSQGSHTIAVATTQTGSAGTQYVFASWSDGGAASHTITVGSTAATYTASFTTEYLLTISASPVAGGTVTPSSGSYYASGTVVPITATANSAYTFSGWSGSVGNAGVASTTVTMSAPQAVTANFASQTGETIQTSPTGLLFSVDGGASQTAPQTLNLSQGSHTIAVATTQAGSSGTQYVFTAWSDGGAASHTITVGSTAATYTASFTTEYQLTTSASPVAGGTVTPSSGSYYASGAAVPIMATANSGYTFTGWSGSVGNATAASTTVTMSAPQTVTAKFGPSGPGAPSITLVQNNYSFILPSAPNYGIAPGSLILIQGTGLTSPGSQAVLPTPPATLPTTLNGSKVTVTVGSTSVNGAFYYACDGHVCNPTTNLDLLAVVLPSTTPVGAGTITVSYNNQPGQPAPINIVAHAFGFDFYGGALAGITDNIQNSPRPGHLITTSWSAQLGETVTFWGSGDGANTKNDDVNPPTNFDQVNGITALYIGGVQAQIGYQGRSGYQGVDQINVTIPANAPTGCAVSVVAVTGTGDNAIVSNSVAMPIATTDGQCTDPLSYVDPATASTLAGKTTVKFGGLSIIHDVSSTGSTSTTTDTAGAIFYSLSGYLLGGYQSSSQPSLGSCFVTQRGPSASNNPYALVGLNAGAQSVTGPNGTHALTELPGPPVTYVAQLPAGFIPAAGGAFTFNGASGADVGAYTAGLDFPNPLVWTNSSSDGTVTRVNGVTVTWTGGASGTYAQISGSSSSTATGFSASFVCNAPVTAGTFTVPEAVLLALPAGTGSLAVSNNTIPQSFTATGLDFGFSIGYASTSVSATYN
jgi:uncharacterized repeat protein (TIGR02543 family)